MERPYRRQYAWLSHSSMAMATLVGADHGEALGQAAAHTAHTAHTAYPAHPGSGPVPSTPRTMNRARVRVASGVTACGGPVTSVSSVPANRVISAWTCSGVVGRPSARC